MQDASQLILFLFTTSQPGKNRGKQENETQEKNTNSRIKAALIVYENVWFIFCCCPWGVWSKGESACPQERNVQASSDKHVIYCWWNSSFSHVGISIWGFRVCATMPYWAFQQSWTDFHGFALSPFLPEQNTSFLEGTLSVFYIYPQNQNPSIQKISALCWNSDTKRHIAGFVWVFTIFDENRNDRVWLCACIAGSAADALYIHGACIKNMFTSPLLHNQECMRPTQTWRAVFFIKGKREADIKATN